MASRRIIAIASGKGGIGKTWFGITLSHVLARTGRRVLLFDGDFGLANVDVQLGLMPSTDLSAVFAGRVQLADAIIQYPAGSFDIIAGRSGSSSLAAIPLRCLTGVADALKQLAHDYDYVILDLAAGIGRNVQLMSMLANEIVVLINNEPTSLTDAYTYIKMCANIPATATPSIVVNTAQSRKHAYDTYCTMSRACINFLSFTPPLLGIIRRDSKVREAIRAQMSIILTAPGSAASVDVGLIAEQIELNIE